MPNSLLNKNRDELLAFSDFVEADVAIISGNPAKRKQVIASDAKVFLAGFTTFSSDWEDILEAQPSINCLMVDELHMGYSNDSSQRTQRLYEAMEQIDLFVGMTGTIINGRLSSIFPSCHLIDPDFYGGYYEFLNEHGVFDEYDHVVGWKRPGKIKRFLKKYAVRRSFEEVYGPEAKVIIPEFVPMDTIQRTAYEELEEASLLELEDSFLDGSFSGAVKVLQSRKVLEHPQSLGAPLNKIATTGKEDRLLVHLEDCKQSGKPMIVFAALVPQIENAARLAEKLGLRAGKIHGGVSIKKRFEIDEAFRSGELDLVIASPATTAVGFNWGHVDTIVFMSLDYMDSSFRQGYRRAIRGVRGKPLLVYVLRYENCKVEDRIFEIVQTKADLAQHVDETVGEVHIKTKKGKQT